VPMLSITHRDICLCYGTFISTVQLNLMWLNTYVLCLKPIGRFSSCYVSTGGRIRTFLNDN
jgi:hypothetical protein